MPSLALNHFVVGPDALWLTEPQVVTVGAQTLRHAFAALQQSAAATEQERVRQRVVASLVFIMGLFFWQCSIGNAGDVRCAGHGAIVAQSHHRGAIFVRDLLVLQGKWVFCMSFEVLFPF